MKNIRRIIQIGFFALFIASFIPSVSDKVRAVSDHVINIQFFPAVIRASIIPVIIILLTLIFGRIYCSSVCPLASVQDVFCNKRNNFRYRKLKTSMRYTVPLLSLFMLIAGYPSIASLPEPYSLTGRIVLFLNRIVIVPLLKFTALIIRQFSVYIPESEIHFSFLPLISALPLLILIIIMSLKRGRLYCNTLCPVGAVLSFFASFSFYSIRIREDSCIGCGACEKICKAEAADSVLRNIDTSKCISCFNCLSVCRFNALEYGKNKNIIKILSGKGGALKKISPFNMLKEKRDNMKKRSCSYTRREFIKTTAAGSAVILSSLYVRQRTQFLKISDKTLSVPPGSESRTNLLSNCSGCSLCINNCPTGVLYPAMLTLSGFGSPYLNYNKGYCDYKCSICSNICPTGAIKKIDPETKKIVKIGEAEFVRKYCIVETDKTSCGACAEVCPTGAIDLIYTAVSESGPLEIPLISNQYCIGCGACQYACPVIEKNAIFVNPFSIHETADPPADKKHIKQENIDTGFAF